MRRDPLRLDVFHHLFASVAEEMGATLKRSSFSPNIRERGDFSCALFDGEGRMIGQASHQPVHLGSTPLSVRAAIEAVPMGPGDAVLLNDPYAGGTHLPDLTLVSPVYLRPPRAGGGSARPDFFCANRAHHADVGGAEPGSMAPTSDIHGEGLRIPPTRLLKQSELERPVLDLLLANMRVPREREADLLAQLSANRIGARRLGELADEYGVAELTHRGRELMDWTEELTRALLRSMPDGSWSFEDVLEGEGSAPPMKLALALKKRGDALECDFRATESWPQSSLNAVRAVTVSAVLYVLRLLLPPGTPTNDGILRPVRIHTRPGTLADASYPSGVASGNVETSQRLVDLLLGAVAQGLAPDVPAASAGTMSNLAFGSRGVGGDGEQGSFVYYETIGGGCGASREGAGAHGVQTHMTNTRNTPVEEFEMRYPVRLLALDLRRGSGGGGERRGGDGIRKRFLFQRPVQLSFMGERHERGPWGLCGGEPGATGRLAVRGAGGGRWRVLPAKVSAPLDEGTELEVWTPGGGGHGAP